MTLYSKSYVILLYRVSAWAAYELRFKILWDLQTRLFFTMYSEILWTVKFKENARQKHELFKMHLSIALSILRCLYLMRINERTENCNSYRKLADPAEVVLSNTKLCVRGKSKQSLKFYEIENFSTIILFFLS